MKLPHIPPRPHFRVPSRQDIMQRAHKGVHTAYFGAVFYEAHGMYAAMGGVLFVFAVVDWFFHID